MKKRVELKFANGRTRIEDIDTDKVRNLESIKINDELVLSKKFPFVKRSYHEGCRFTVRNSIADRLTSSFSNVSGDVHAILSDLESLDIGGSVPCCSRRNETEYVLDMPLKVVAHTFGIDYESIQEQKLRSAISHG